MTQKYELIVKGIRNFENKVTVTLALRDKERFDGEIFDLDISLDHVEGAALEFYEAAARRSIRQVFLDVAAGLCEGDELLPETRPCSEGRYTIKINSSDNSITGC
ncbi:TPA: YdfR family protein [Escherichia coli]|nr:YdfR family protein [Escherichia coli]EIZ4580165.1 YdfR family protein [Escherichia coli]MCI3349458.1 YdfR family protein [Escherichia coli]HCK2332559.1 YdfR family protein [Escherichia coli]HCN5703151.1 YdfR family protein [Escherichia coli]